MSTLFSDTLASDFCGVRVAAAAKSNSLLRKMIYGFEGIFDKSIFIFFEQCFYFPLLFWFLSEAVKLDIEINMKRLKFMTAVEVEKLQ